MISVSSFFSQNMVFVFFVYGLAYFSMGLAVVLESRKSSSLKLCHNLIFLGGFGLVHGLVEWLDMSILIVAPTILPETELALEAAGIFLLVVSVAFLILFGARQMASRTGWKWLVWVPVLFCAAWAIAVVADLVADGFLSQRWITNVNVLTRYLLYLPANILASMGLAFQVSEFIKGKVPRIAYAAAGATVALAFNAVVAGLVVPAAPFLPASVLNYNSFFTLTGIPVQVLRAGTAIAIAFFVLRILRVFELEHGRQLEAANDERLRAHQEALEIGRRAQLQTEQWNRELQHKTRELSALFEAAKILASTLDLSTLLEKVVAVIVELLEPADICVLFLYDRSIDKLVLRSAKGYESPLFSEMKIAPGEAIAGKAFRDSRTLVCLSPEQVAQDRRDLSSRNQALLRMATQGLPAVQEALCTPLIYKGRAIGILLLENRFARAHFSETDVQLVQALADQVAVAIENARLYEEVQRKEQLRGQLLEKVIHAQEEERKRIARELHDEASQALTALIISLESAEEALPDGLGQIKDRLASITGLTIQTLDEIKKIIIDLRPTLLDDLGLIPALRWYAKSHSERSGIKIGFHAEGFRQRLPAQMETVLFRVVQEAITNVTRHSQASFADVRLERNGSAVTAVIEDDGVGFDLAETLDCQDNGRGLGLMGMKERIALLGGTLSIDSKPGQGARVSFQVPLYTWETEAV